MRYVRLVLEYLICLRADALGLVFGGLLSLLGGKPKFRFLAGALFIQARGLHRHGMTLSPHVIALRDLSWIEKRPALPAHELAHGEQSTAGAVGWLPVDVIAVAGLGWWTLLAGCLSHFIFHSAGYGAAWLRGEDIYYGSHAEEAARAAARKR